MMTLTVDKILERTKQKISSYIDDTIPITIAIADPMIISTGVSIQRDYPLTEIERRFGIPFGKLLSDPNRFIANPDELHGCKWGLEVHEAVFQNDALNEQFIRTGEREGKVLLAMSTGIGNVLQNLGTVAYVNGKLYYVIGEDYANYPPYCCLVKYITNNTNKQNNPIGIDLLLFLGDGSKCRKLSKSQYRDSAALKEEETGFETKIRWAVSGYPLVLDGKKVSLDLTAKVVSDYRHVWRLPKLQESLVSKLAQKSELNDEQKKMIEFYFGFGELQNREHLLKATHDESIKIPLSLYLQGSEIQQICDVCKIKISNFNDLDQFHQVDKLEEGTFKLKKDEVIEDFVNSGYQKVETEKEVVNPGQFFIDSGRNLIVKLLPAIYPHHIVGISSEGSVVNISIGGKSGRSGITIENAKSLCSELELRDAIIFDNGNDVIARIGGGAVICHKDNQRQTRLTASLHFGSFIESKAFGGSFKGFEMAYSTCEVKRLETNSKIEEVTVRSSQTKPAQEAKVSQEEAPEVN